MILSTITNLVDPLSSWSVPFFLVLQPIATLVTLENSSIGQMLIDAYQIACTTTGMVDLACAPTASKTEVMKCIERVLMVAERFVTGPDTFYGAILIELYNFKFVFLILIWHFAVLRF